MTETLSLTPTETVTVRRCAPDALEVEVAYGPGGGPPPKHLHPEQDERFEVLAGTLHVRLDGREVVLATGDVLEIPRGAVHQMWNGGDDEVRAVWETRPAGRTLEWFRALDAAGPKPGPLAFGVLLDEYRDTFRLAVAPAPLLRGAFGALAFLGRRRGHGRLVA